MSPRRLLFYVQHLLGIGHLKRAATLTRALVAAGFDVTVVSGGMEVPGVDLGTARFVQLAATRATDVSFKTLVDANDTPIDDGWRARRRDALLDVYTSFNPQVLLFELFPFGRRQMRFEVMPVIEDAAQRAQRPVIVSSVRDVLVAQAKEERNREMLALVNQYFDHVLVHGDPGFIPFDRTFLLAREIAGKLIYTGYVVDRSGRSAINTGQGQGEVIVSAGGGAVGIAFLRVAMQARALTALNDRPWRILVGVNVPADDFARLQAIAPDGCIVERGRADFTALLTNCTLSLSQGGYNTVMEALEAGARTVVVPYAGGLETEQTLRAREFERRGVLHVVDEPALSPDSLAAAVTKAMAAPPGNNRSLDTSGAETSARLLRGWADAVPW